MRKQRGVTMIGWIFLLVPVALVLYAGIRVGPEYLNYYKVSQALKATAAQLKSEETLSPQTIRSSIERRFDIGYVEKITSNDIEVKKGGSGWEMTTAYEGVAPLFGNVSIVIDFNKTVVID